MQNFANDSNDDQLSENNPSESCPNSDCNENSFDDHHSHNGFENFFAQDSFPDNSEESGSWDRSDSEATDQNENEFYDRENSVTRARHWLETCRDYNQNRSGHREKRLKITGSSGTRPKYAFNKHAEAFRTLEGSLTHQGGDRQWSGRQSQSLAPISNSLTANNTRNNANSGSREQSTSPDQDQFEKLLLQLIVVHGITFNDIQSGLFKTMCTLLNRSAQIPSMAILKERLDSSTENKRLQLKEFLLKSNIGGAITVDYWTNQEQTGYLGVTLHFMTPAFNPASIVVGMDHFKDSHSPWLISDILFEVIQCWGLEKRLIGGTTDQGANIKEAMKLLAERLPIDWVPCLSHTIQCCVNKALVDTAKVKALLVKCRKISIFFRECSIAMNILNNEQDKLQGKRFKLIVLPNVVERWSSHLKAIERVLYLSKGITATRDTLMLGSNDDKAKGEKLGQLIISDEETMSLQEIVKLLQPAAILTYWINENRNPTISQKYHKIYSMLPPLDTFTTTEARELHKNLDAGIKESWPLSDIKKSVLIAIYLNPATAALDFWRTILYRDGEKDVSLRDKAKALLVKELVGIYQKDKERYRRVHGSGQMQHPQKRAQILKITTSPEYRTMLEYQAQMVMAFYEYIVSNDKQLGQFINRPQEYWKINKDAEYIRDLVPIARRYLCLQAVAPSKSEQLFNKASRILATPNSKLCDTALSNVMFSSSFEEYFLQHGE